VDESEIIADVISCGSTLSEDKSGLDKISKVENVMSDQASHRIEIKQHPEPVQLTSAHPKLDLKVLFCSKLHKLNNKNPS